MITTPNTIPLPEEVAKEVEKAKQQLTVDELALHNVRKARIAEEYTISELVKQKQELEAQIEDLSILTAKLQEETQQGKKEVENLSAEKTELIKEKQQIEASISSFKVEMNERLSEVERREQQLSVKEAEAKIELADAEEKKTNALAFAKKVQELISSHK